MAECEKLSTCPFFNDRMSNMPATAEIMKKMYCRTDNSKCARYMVFKKLGNVPPDLFPNDLERAKKIISQTE